MDAIYRLDGHHILTGPNATGPWDPTMQHGSAPSSLVTYIAETVSSPEPMQIVRLTMDLLRPVPVAPLTYQAEVLREGRKIQLVEVRLFAKEIIVARATVLKMRIQQPDLPKDVAGPAVSLPSPEECPLLAHKGTRNPFLAGLTMRGAVGDFLTPGPGAIWFKLHREIVEGKAVSPAMRAVVAADFSNGTSSLLDFRAWTFINADLSVNLARPPVGEWILLDAESWLGPDGAGIAAARLADVHGYFGRAVQSLVIEPRVR